MVAQDRAPFLFDAENHLVIHAGLSRCDSLEWDLDSGHLEALRLLPRDERILLTLDSAYASLRSVCALEREDVSYVMRISSMFEAEILEAAHSDSKITIIITANQARDCQARGMRVPTGTVLTVRVIKIPVDADKIEETIITNVSAEMLSYNAIRRMYDKYWGQKATPHYNTIKNRISGLTPLAVEQDYQSAVLLANVETVMTKGKAKSLRKTQN